MRPLELASEYDRWMSLGLILSALGANAIDGGDGGADAAEPILDFSAPSESLGSAALDMQVSVFSIGLS